MIPNIQEDSVAERINTLEIHPSVAEGGERHLNIILLCHVRVLERKLSDDDWKRV